MVGAADGWTGSALSFQQKSRELLYVDGFSEWGINSVIYAYYDPVSFWGFRELVHETCLEIKKRFEAEGVEFVFQKYLEASDNSVYPFHRGGPASKEHLRFKSYPTSSSAPRFAWARMGSYICVLK